MTRLVLVRHGQANSADLDAYDDLSEIGVLQARELGIWFADHYASMPQVVVGPRRRHVQTWEVIADALERRGVAAPDVQSGRAFDEHDGIAMFKAALPLLRERPDTAALAEAADRGDRRAIFGAFRAAMMLWAAGEVRTPGVEQWVDFRVRADGVLATYTEEHRGETVAITSGGLITGVVGSLLGLDDAHLLNLMWSPYNASMTEIAFTPHRLALERFNMTPHLGAELLTKV